MTIHVLARINTIGTDFAAGNFNIGLEIAATDGAVDSTPASPLLQVPLTATRNQINDAIVAHVVAVVSALYGQPVDSRNIFYQPFDRG